VTLVDDAMKLPDRLGHAVVQQQDHQHTARAERVSGAKHGHESKCQDRNESKALHQELRQVKSGHSPVVLIFPFGQQSGNAPRAHGLSPFSFEQLHLLYPKNGFRHPDALFLPSTVDVHADAGLARKLSECQCDENGNDDQHNDAYRGVRPKHEDAGDGYAGQRRQGVTESELEQFRNGAAATF
jgi:hypothetical protein